MKKAFLLVMAFVLVLGLSSCAQKEYELPWDHFCYSANDESVIELSSEQKGVIIDLLNNGKWYGEIAKCTSDVKFATKRQSIGYCISEGIFNDFTQNKSLRLSDEDRSTINGYLVKQATKLIDIEEYKALKIEDTTSIEVVYGYIKGEFTTYEFVIDNQETIKDIMTEIVNMELKKYPEDQDIDFYPRWITVKQGDNEHLINLAYVSDNYGNSYLCQSQTVCEIIEKYIEDNLIQ